MVNNGTNHILGLRLVTEEQRIAYRQEHPPPEPVPTFRVYKIERQGRGLVWNDIAFFDESKARQRVDKLNRGMLARLGIRAGIARVYELSERERPIAAAFVGVKTVR